MGVQETGKTVKLSHESGASAEIYLFGATVTSWQVEGKERLFLSSKSSLDASKSVGGVPEIRGGIPICFPIFADPPPSPVEYAALPFHGFVRTVDWKLDKVIMDRHEGVSVRFLSPPPPPGFAQHKYKLALVVTLSAHELSTDIHITNEGTEEFKFAALLHTYIAVPDATKISVEGIDAGVKYIDKIDNFKEKTWEGGPVKVTKTLDSIFKKVPSQEIKLDYGDGSSSLKIRFKGFEDCVMWNPRKEKGSTMPDLEDGGWDKMITIEPGYVREQKVLQPGEEFLGQQVLSVK